MLLALIVGWITYRRGRGFWRGFLWTLAVEFGVLLTVSLIQGV